MSHSRAEGGLLSGPEGMLYVRLQILEGKLSSILVASPHSDGSATSIAVSLAASAERSGSPIRLLLLYGPGVETADDLEGMRAHISKFDGLTVVQGQGVLDDPATLLACAATGVVVLAIRRGKTSRASLEETRREVERAGGHIAGAVMVK